MIVAKRKSAIVEEGADYLLDLEIGNPKRKRLICSGLKEAMKDSEMDESYSVFLDGLLELCESKLEEENDDDPTYMMFFNNLQEHEHAYMIDVSVEHGVFSPIIYELEDETTDELRRKTADSRGCTLIRESRSLGFDGNRTSVERMIGTLRSGAKRMNSLKENNNGQVRKRTSLSEDDERISNVKRASASRAGECSSLDQNGLSNLRRGAIDPVYKAFLDGLKVVGQSVFYEYGEHKERVYYEMGNQEISSGVDVHSLETAPRTHCVTPRPSTPPSRQTFSRKQPTSTPTPRPSESPPIQQISHPSLRNIRSVSNASNKMLKVKDNGKASQDEHSSFWKKLERIVREPYTWEQYEDYWEKVNDRRTVGVHRETRSGGYQSEAGPLGKSYLDMHPDLKCEIEKVETDRRKVLNLLRSFFCYLQYVPHGVPRPWMSDSGKRILFGSLQDDKIRRQESF